MQKDNLLSDFEKWELRDIVAKSFYMGVLIGKVDKFVKKDKAIPYKKAILEAFNHIEGFMQGSKEEVGELQEERKERGEISDLKQSGKAIAGAMFPKLVHYIFLKNKEVGNIPSNVRITRSKTKAQRTLGDDFLIFIGGETQKPDCDIIIYNEDTEKSMILSTKTSLRERAGQTFKWKLLLEIAVSNEGSIKRRYGIKYKGKNMPLVCFATPNFYEEINSPQQRGMFKMFDGSFIARPNVKHDLVKPLSTLPGFVSKNLCQ